MTIVVQKFGGTSVGDEDARSHLVAKVQQAQSRGERVVLVVSAMGRRGSPYATDTLLEILRKFDPEPEPITRDLLVSSGETISASLISGLLKSHGLPAVPMTAYTAGILAQGPFGDAIPTHVDTRAILAVLDQHMVPVITGFQAVNQAKDIVTLGRGGSDTSAVAVGAAIKADFVDIFTDVPGVAKADPRVIPEAEYMEFLDYASMTRYAAYGARVLHDRSALLAEQNGLLLRVRSTFEDGEGTLIGPAGTLEGQASRRPQTPDFIGLASITEPDGTRRVTAVFAAGRGRAGIAASLESAGAFPAARIPIEDRDAVSFRCPADLFPRFARALYEGAQKALAKA